MNKKMAIANGRQNETTNTMEGRAMSRFTTNKEVLKEIYTAFDELEAIGETEMLDASEYITDEMYQELYGMTWELDNSISLGEEQVSTDTESGGETVFKVIEPAEGASNTHQNKRIGMEMVDMVIIRNRKGDLAVAKGDSSMLVDKSSVRVIAKENVLGSREAVKEALVKYGVHYSTVKAVLKRLDAHKGGAIDMNELFDFTKSQVAKEFASEFVIVLRKEKQEQYASVTANSHDFENGVAKKSNIQGASENHFFKTVADGEPIYVAKSKTVEGAYDLATAATGREVKSALNVAIISSKLPADVAKELKGKELQAAHELAKAKLADAIKNGVIINGEKYVYITHSPSQERVGSATFVRDDLEGRTVLEFRRKLKISIQDYLSIGGDIYNTKSMKRNGLALSNTKDLSHLNALLDGKATYEAIHGGMSIITIHGPTKDIRILLTPDVEAVANHGESDVLDITETMKSIKGTNIKKAGKLATVQNKDLKKALPISDGSGLIDKSLLSYVNKTIGYDPSMIQFRETTTKSKGTLTVLRIKSKLGVDMVLPDSVVKGSFGKLVRDENARLDFKFVGAPKKAGRQAEFTMAPQQLLNTAGVSSELSEKLAEEMVQRFTDILSNEEAAKEYIRHEAVESSLDNAISIEHRESILDTSLATKIQRMIFAYPGAIKDSYVRTSLYRTFDKSMKAFKTGQYEIKGNYKFMSHDPILFLEVTRHNLFKKNDQITLLDEETAIEKGFNYIKAGNIVIMDEEGKLFRDDKLMVARMPLVHYGETVIAEGELLKQYFTEKKYNKAFGQNMVIFSVFDLNAFSMGGGDFDGDIAFVITDERFITEVENRKEKLGIRPVLDISVTFDEKGNLEEVIEGCPFPSEVSSVKFPGNLEGIKELGKGKFKIDLEAMTDESEAAFYQYEATLAANGIDGNDIGLYTNRASILIDSIHHVERLLSSGTVPSNKLAAVEAELEKMMTQVGILRLAQGWDIDKAKHGGDFVNYIDLSFMYDAPAYAAAVVYNASKKGFKINKDRNGNRKWKKLAWLHSDSIVVPGIPFDKQIEALKNERVLTESVMSNQMIFNNQIWDDVVLASESKESFSPDQANLVDEFQGIATDLSTNNFIVTEMKKMVGNYGKDIYAATNEAKDVTKVNAYSISSPINEDEAFTYLFREVAEKHTNILREFTEKYEASVPGFSAMVGRAAYLVTNSSDKVRRNSEAVKSATTVSDVLSASVAGLSYPTVIAFDQVVDALEILGDDDLRSAYEREVEESKRTIKSNIKARVLFTDEAIAIYKNSQALAHSLNTHLDKVSGLISIEKVTTEAFGREIQVYGLSINNFVFGHLPKEFADVLGGQDQMDVRISSFSNVTDKSASFEVFSTN